MPANTIFNWAAGELDLVRFPVPRDYSLQAFSAADAYILNHVADNYPSVASPLAINDAFGALTLGLSLRGAAWMGHNWSAKHAMEENARRNGLGVPDTFWLGEVPWTHEPGLVVMLVPKEHDLLEYQLSLISRSLPAGIAVIAGGMTRNIHNSTIRLFETYLIDVTSSLAWKKARLITGTTAGERGKPFPANTSYIDPKSGATVVSLPGVFSADHPDPGSSLLANTVPPLPSGSEVLDLGCGNGYLLAVAGKKNNGLMLFGCDDSLMAVQSTVLTLAQNGLEGDIRHGHATADYRDASMDVVLCNPPFHQGHSRHDQIAWEMFVGAKRVLKANGVFYVVGNRNQGYHIQLGRLFRTVDVHASDTTYTVFRCKKDGS